MEKGEEDRQTLKIAGAKCAVISDEPYELSMTTTDLVLRSWEWLHWPGRI